MCIWVCVQMAEPEGADALRYVVRSLCSTMQGNRGCCSLCVPGYRAMAGAAFAKSNEKKLKKQAKAEAAAAPARAGFRRVAGGKTSLPPPKKISAAAKAEARAGGSGSSADADDGEVEQEEEDESTKRASKKSKKAGGGGKSSSSNWRYFVLLALICGGGLQVVIPVLESIFGMLLLSTLVVCCSTPHVLCLQLPPKGSGARSSASASAYPPVSHHRLEVSDTAALKRVFFSGESWLVLCNNHTTGEPVHKVFERAAAMLHHTGTPTNSCA